MPSAPFVDAPRTGATAARLHELAGKKEEAAAMYGKYLELTGSQVGQGKADPTRDMVQSRLNQLKK